MSNMETNSKCKLAKTIDNAYLLHTSREVISMDIIVYTVISSTETELFSKLYCHISCRFDVDLLGSNRFDFKNKFEHIMNSLKNKIYTGYLI